ncbi:unnamed protein product [Bursaphelenchus xylophilus]|uniref:(pine wood nematode) hypothetical protein n=1 Tax=Bursaphelenchus xylophilus TaxID=6326 RepID=A0A1I7SUN5_BURXY|nr:unnamed protein product [Bursaphelenchus xylophilus]CAG9125996.1 unnamed protein product [Bursaphelenchus xylophilus]
MSSLLLFCLAFATLLHPSTQQECADGEEVIVPKDIADLKKSCEDGFLKVTACLFDGGEEKGGFDVPVNRQATYGTFTYGCALKDDDIIPYVTSPLGPLSRLVRRVY